MYYRAGREYIDAVNAKQEQCQSFILSLYTVDSAYNSHGYKGQSLVGHTISKEPQDLSAISYCGQWGPRWPLHISGVHSIVIQHYFHMLFYFN